MILLLDTYVFLWRVNGEPISSRAADLLAAGSTTSCSAQPVRGK